jgi:hypothetical protein
VDSDRGDSDLVVQADQGTLGKAELEGKASDLDTADISDMVLVLVLVLVSVSVLVSALVLEDS